VKLPFTKLIRFYSSWLESLVSSNFSINGKISKELSMMKAKIKGRKDL